MYRAMYLVECQHLACHLSSIIHRDAHAVVDLGSVRVARGSRGTSCISPGLAIHQPVSSLHPLSCLKLTFA